MSLAQQLHTLETVGLIRLAQPQPALEYLFRHALLKDAAYSSLLKADRRALHQTVGELLAQWPSEHSEELAPLLGEHFARGGEVVRARNYFSQAGDAAARRSANAEAQQFYTRALELCATGVAAPTPQLIHLYTRLGRLQELQGDYAAALATYAAATQTAQARADQPLALTALVLRATVHCSMTPFFDPALGAALCAEAQALAQQLGEVATEAKILWSLMLLYFFSGQNQQALVVGEQAAQLARAHQLTERLAFVLNDLAGHVYLATGQLTQAQAALYESRALWQALENWPMLVNNYNNAGFNRLLLGELVEARADAQQAAVLARRINNAWGLGHSGGVHGYAEMELGDGQTAFAVLAESLHYGAQGGFAATPSIVYSIYCTYCGYMGDYATGLQHGALSVHVGRANAPFWLPTALGAWAWCAAQGGQLATARTYLQEAYALGPIEQLAFYSAHAIFADCELALQEGAPARVVALLEKLLPLAENQNLRLAQAKFLHYQAQAQWALGQTEAAVATWQTAAAVATAVGARHTLWRILAAHSAALQTQGQGAAASDLRGQAQVVAQYVADHAPSEQRATFLALPAVAVLGVA